MCEKIKFQAVSEKLSKTLGDYFFVAPYIVWTVAMQNL